MSAQCGCASCRTRGLLGPAVLVAIGVLWLFSRLGGAFSFHTTWPILLIVIGIVKVGEALSSREGHVGS